MYFVSAISRSSKILSLSSINNVGISEMAKSIQVIGRESESALPDEKQAWTSTSASISSLRLRGCSSSLHRIACT